VGSRYHPAVIWGPFVLALVLGLVVSAGLYFAYLWPQVEPLDEDEEAAEAAAAAEADKPTTKQAAKKPGRKRAKA
jgi:hypothetical protein